MRNDTAPVPAPRVTWESLEVFACQHVQEFIQRSSKRGSRRSSGGIAPSGEPRSTVSEGSMPRATCWSR